MSSATFEKRFWSRVNITDSCWLWIGSVSADGYGRISVGAGKYYRSHRISWEMHNGEIPCGLYICHRCDNPKCVNPDHLFLGTQLENMSDMVQKGRSKRRSKLNEKQISEVLRLASIGYKNRELASMFGVGKTAIGNITRRLSVSI